ncbi:SRPBCC family protein [Rhodococcus sp. IEGM 1379]|uniref:SRPBCC family protein n=1 Tax=Rhodococcus sp. IEGM 1379 TaxID=3047086 RepID=UPI0024B69DC4|nr:SRPBCC family protein [Rhodococcus sp. IEGM 1379]MDI9914051.1 SRPBCC family protein [Rhodococcus sp. IEGM 1379]
MTDFDFRSEWVLTASADRVYDMLADAENYSLWWPQVRRVRMFDADSGSMTIRSVVPLTLDVFGRREVEDPVARLLKVNLSGAMTGWSRWTVRPSGIGCVADFRQEVTVSGALGVAARVAKPVFEWNHAAMMRGGYRGLSAYLSVP